MAKTQAQIGRLAFLNGLLTLLVLGIIVAGGVAYWGITQYYADGPKTEETAFLVPKGATLQGLAAPLEEQGLVEQRPASIGERWRC